MISYRVYMMTGPFHISLFEGTFHVDKTQNRKHYARATRSILQEPGWTHAGVTRAGMKFCGGIM